MGIRRVRPADDAKPAGKLYPQDRHAPRYGNAHHNYGPEPRHDLNPPQRRSFDGDPSRVREMYERGRHHPYGRPHDHLDKAHPRHDTFQPEDVPAERNKGHIGVDVFDQHHPAYQKPQAPEDRQASDYDNDVPVTEWTRAGAHPHFDSGPSGHRYRK